MEIHGGLASLETAFASENEFKAVEAWLPSTAFQAGFGVSYLLNVGPNHRLGIGAQVSRLLFNYANSQLTDGNGLINDFRPLSTRRVYLHIEPIYAFRFASSTSFDWVLQTKIGVQIPVNAITLAGDAGGNDLQLQDFDRGSFGGLMVYSFSLVPTLVWDEIRLGLFFNYNLSGINNSDGNTGFSGGLTLSYFLE
jgi:hypothetical protein